MTNDETPGVRTWVEIDRGAIRDNYTAFRELVPTGVKLLAIVKSNAYGHGLKEFSLEVVGLGADFLGVDSITEGIALRRAGLTLPMLVLGYTLPENYAIAARHGISLTVSSDEGLAALAKVDVPVRVHVKIDSGMHRQGFYPEDAARVAGRIRSMPQVTLEGVYTHFANAKDPDFPDDTVRQADVFARACDAFGEAGFSFLRHASATAGTLLFPEYHFDMVRVGIGLYGLWPEEEVARALSGKLALRPALSWKTIVAETKTVPRGEGIGYGFTEIFERDTRVAVCPIGYWHGFPRALSSTGVVLIRGLRARVLGRVTMDMIMVDVTDGGAAVGDEVVLIGSSGTETVTAEEMAERSGTSPYEIITRINPKIRRVTV